MIKPWIKCKNTPHVNKALVQLTAFTEDKWSSRVPASKTKLTRIIPDHQWAQPSWHLTSSKRSCLLGFLICWGFFFFFSIKKFKYLCLLKELCWRSYIQLRTTLRLSTHSFLPLFPLQQDTLPELLPRRVQFHEQQPNRENILILLERIAAPLPFSFWKCQAVKSYHFTCLVIGSRVNLTPQYFPALHLSSHLVHELQKSSPSSARFQVGEQWREGGRSTLSSSNLRSLSHVPQI